MWDNWRLFLLVEKKHNTRYDTNGKNGRLFILFVALIISSYVRHIWKSTGLKDRFGSTLEVLDEM